jgi:hypothetical protein
MQLVRLLYRFALVAAALGAVARPGSALAAGGYVAKQPTAYRGSCDLIKSYIVSVQVGDRCVAVHARKAIDSKLVKPAAQ